MAICIWGKGDKIGQRKLLIICRGTEKGGTRGLETGCFGAQWGLCPACVVHMGFRWVDRERPDGGGLLCGSWATIVPSQKGDICPGFPRLWSTPLASILSQQLIAFVTDKWDQERHSRHVKPRDQCPLALICVCFIKTPPETPEPSSVRSSLSSITQKRVLDQVISLTSESSLWSLNFNSFLSIMIFTCKEHPLI